MTRKAQAVRLPREPLELYENHAFPENRSPMRSKWQSLPTEAINPSSLGIDKLQPDDIV